MTRFLIDAVTRFDRAVMAATAPLRSAISPGGPAPTGDEPGPRTVPPAGGDRATQGGAP